ncbi:MAG TPA: ABC transporter ATP-binding protein [Terriglobales bacterium]|nr:ABC transporter ATP-binding protein [Terriglobales bacterium]
MERDVILRVKNLAKIFHSGGESVVVFEGLNLEVRQGELVALVGESGTGKTTLLHLLAALDTPTEGELYFAGQRLSELGSEGQAEYRNQRIGFVWQMHHLLPEFSALENVMLPQLIAGKDVKGSQGRARELLAEVGLEKALGRRVGELSGGEQQRVALARALVNGPSLLLADEPTGNLDRRTAELVVDLLERLHRVHGLTSVLATHNMELAQRAARLLRLENGQLTEVVVPRFN